MYEEIIGGEVEMGCDIHFNVERRRDDGTWECMHAPKDKYGSTEYYGDRHYFLFALLAGVRNGYGDGALVPFSKPRGLPEDVSDEVKERYDRWNGDGHSHSHFAIDELLGFDWDKTYPSEEYLTLQAYVSWADKSLAPEHPYRFKFNARSMGDECLSMEEADAFLQTDLGIAAQVMEKNYAVLAKWNQPYRNRCHGFMMAIDKILELDDDPSNLRIVFWFDN